MNYWWKHLSQNRPDCTRLAGRGAPYHTFTWASVLLMSTLDSWLGLEDNPLNLFCLSLSSAPNLGTLGLAQQWQPGCLKKKSIKWLGTSYKTSLTGRKKQSKKLPLNSKVPSPVIPDVLREQSQIYRDQHYQEQLRRLCCYDGTFVCDGVSLTDLYTCGRLFTT